MKRKIPVLPGVDDPMVSAAIAKDWRAKSPMQQALHRKKMAEWLTVNAGVDHEEAAVLVAKWCEDILKQNPDTKWHYFKLTAKAKLGMLGWWMRHVLLTIFFLPAIAWYGLRRRAAKWEGIVK